MSNRILEEALRIIANWELPETGDHWNGRSGDPVSFEAKHGTHGARTYMMTVAREALAHNGVKHLQQSPMDEFPIPMSMGRARVAQLINAQAVIDFSPDEAKQDGITKTFIRKNIPHNEPHLAGLLEDFKITQDKFHRHDCRCCTYLGSTSIFADHLALMNPHDYDFYVCNTNPIRPVIARQSENSCVSAPLSLIEETDQTDILSLAKRLYLARNIKP